MEMVHALIIDDDKDTANLFRTILTLVGFECTAVYTAKAALSHLAANEPDIVLLDLRLGLELDGGDILYQIRSNPRFAKTRVIVITAYPGMLEHMDALADLILLKPVEVEDLQTLSSRLTQLKPKAHVFRDPVSGLYNFTFFMSRLEHIVERARRNPGVWFATMAIQCVVGPKGNQKLEVVETEQILKRVSEILTKDFRPTDTFGYLEGERVVALYEDLRKPEDVHVIIRRMQEDFVKDAEEKDYTWSVTPIIGAALNDPQYNTAEEIFNAAVDTLNKAIQVKGKYYLVAELSQH